MPAFAPCPAALCERPRGSRNRGVVKGIDADPGPKCVVRCGHCSQLIDDSIEFASDWGVNELDIDFRRLAMAPGLVARARHRAALRCGDARAPPGRPRTRRAVLD